MIAFGITGLIIGSVLVFFIRDADIAWVRGYLLLLLSLLLILWDVSSDVITTVETSYVVTNIYNKTAYPKEVIISESIHKTSPVNLGAIFRCKIDTTYEFIKFYEIGDMDEFKNITRF